MALLRLATDAVAERVACEDFVATFLLERLHFELLPEVGIDLDGRSEAT